MNQEPSERSVRAIFAAAMRYADARDQAVYLDDVCGDDWQLRATVERLLAARNQIDANPLDRVLEAMRPEEMRGAVLDSGERIDGASYPNIAGYKILDLLGEGGMGVVYLAEQEQPVRRKVALKVIKPGMDTRQVVARFQAERQALAMMEHPNIAKVFDAGSTHDDRPYFVMELVRGQTITDFCNHHRFNARQRLELLAKVCWAVQHTHQNGIIHRDLKPSNVMVEMHNTEPVPKIIDFGVAKATQQPLTDQTLFTRFVQMIGTPLYMSPEQADLNAMDVDTRSDVYSLGVLMYELLTGQTPFAPERIRRVGYDELRQIIRFEEPLRPSLRLSTLTVDQRSTLEQIHGVSTPQIERRLRGELDWIVMKALEKDRTQRYETAAALAHDLECYLNGDPVSARPPSVGYQLTKFARRHKGVLAATVAVLAALLLGTAASFWYAWQTNRALRLADQRLADSTAALAAAKLARTEAERATGRAQLALYQADMKLASDAYQIGDIPRVVALLQRHVPREGDHDLRGFEWSYLHRLVDIRPRWKHDLASSVHCVSHSPQGDRIVVAAGDGRIRIYAAATGRLLCTFVSSSTANGVTWHPNGEQIACASEDGYVRLWHVSYQDDAAEPRDSPTTGAPDSTTVILNQPDLLWKAHDGQVKAVQFSPDGRTIASCGDDRRIRTWQATTGQPRKDFLGHEREVEAIAWSADGSTLASASSDRTIGLWNTDSGERLHRWGLETAGGRIVTVAMSVDGVLIAAGDIEGNLIVIQRASSEIATARQLDGIECITFLDHGHQIATADRGGAIRVWSVATQQRGPVRLVAQEASHWHAHRGRIFTISASTRADNIVSGSRGGQIASWPPLLRAAWHADCQGEDFVADDQGTLLVCQHEIHRFDLVRRRWVSAIAPSKALWENLAASADGSRIAVSAVGTVAVYETASNTKLASWVINQDPNAIAISPDGQWVAVSWWDQDQKIDLFQVQNAEQRWRLSAPQSECVRFSPNSRYLAAGAMDDLLLYDLATRKLLRRFTGHDSTLSSLAFHPEGQTVATVSHDRRLKIWDVESGRLLQSVEAHRQRVRSVCFSRDGRTIATCSDDGLARLWHAETTQPLLSISVGAPLRKVDFADDDGQLVVQLQDRRILAFGVPATLSQAEPAGTPISSAELRGLGSPPATKGFQSMAISADGRVLVGNYAHGDDCVPFRWTPMEGMQPLPVPNEYRRASVISADSTCQVVSGRFVRQDGATLLGRWNDVEDPPVIEPLPVDWRQILVLGQSGSRAVGYGFKVDSQQRCAFVMDGRRFHELPSVGSRKNVSVTALSEDGELLIGTAWSRNGPALSQATVDLRVVHWRDGTADLLPGFGAEAYNWRATACSADGSVVVGHRWPAGTTPSDGVGLAFRWEAGLTETLGELFGGGVQSIAHGVSADGRWVVGSSWTESGETAFVWERHSGMRRLEELLRQQGADIRGWHLHSALAISADGTHIAGYGENPVGASEIFLARISTD